MTKIFFCKNKGCQVYTHLNTCKYVCRLKHRTKVFSLHRIRAWNIVLFLGIKYSYDMIAVTK